MSPVACCGSKSLKQTIAVGSKSTSFSFDVGDFKSAAKLDIAATPNQERWALHKTELVGQQFNKRGNVKKIHHAVLVCIRLGLVLVRSKQIHKRLDVQKVHLPVLVYIAK